MDGLKLNRNMLNPAGMIFIFLFTLIFTVTNLVMIDFRGLQSLIASQDAFMILTLMVILGYVYKNSRILIPFSKIKTGFLALWTLYIVSMLLSMVVSGHFILSEAVILIMITVLFLYRMPKELVIYIILGALLSIPSLLLTEGTLNESGATLVLVFAAGFLLMPKSNKWVALYALATFAMLLMITTGRTAILTYLIVLAVHLAYINLYKTQAGQKKIFIGTAMASVIATLALFFRPLYQFFTAGGVSRDGIDWNELTSVRYELWATVFRNREWLGEGHSYFDFTHHLHAHNILFDTLGRYGIITAVLFTGVLAFVLLLSIRSVKTFSIAVYIFIFILIGMFEYSWLFMFVYFAPIILFFVFAAYMVSETEDGGFKHPRQDIDK